MLVVGPKAALSNYVQQEGQFALQADATEAIGLGATALPQHGTVTMVAKRDT